MKYFLFILLIFLLSVDCTEGDIHINSRMKITTLLNGHLLAINPDDGTGDELF
jgi:hypothetical protein